MGDGWRPREHLEALVGMVYRRTLRRLGRELEPLGMTPVEGVVLMMLRDGGEFSLGDLARLWEVSPPVMSRMVDGLVRRGYVERRPGREDRRRTEMALTRLGLKATEQVEAAGDRTAEAMTSRLEADEVDRLQEYLGRVLDALVAEEGRAGGAEQGGG